MKALSEESSFANLQNDYVVVSFKIRRNTLTILDAWAYALRTSRTALIRIAIHALLACLSRNQNQISSVEQLAQRCVGL